MALGLKLNSYTAEFLVSIWFSCRLRSSAAVKGLKSYLVVN